MEHEDAFRAVKLPFPPQEYLCTWKLPDIRLKNNEGSQGEGCDGGVLELNLCRITDVLTVFLRHSPGSPSEEMSIAHIGR